MSSSITSQHTTSLSRPSDGLEAILESDAAYFDAGAVLEPIDGAVIARMEGLEALPSACAVHRIETNKLPTDLDGWLVSVEEHLKSRKVCLARIYLLEADEGLEQALQGRGYHNRVEDAVAVKPGAVESRFPFRPIVTDADWQEKAALHQLAELSSDGYRSNPAQWVELERRKCEAGYMEAWLIEENREVVGAVSSARVGDLLRVKNLLVHPEFRGRGIAEATIRQFSGMARDQGAALVGAIRMAGVSTAGFYQKAGWRKLGEQTEWTKTLNA